MKTKLEQLVEFVYHGPSLGADPSDAFDQLTQLRLHRLGYGHRALHQQFGHVLCPIRNRVLQIENLQQIAPIHRQKQPLG